MSDVGPKRSSISDIPGARKMPLAELPSLSEVAARAVREQTLILVPKLVEQATERIKDSLFAELMAGVNADALIEEIERRLPEKKYFGSPAITGDITLRSDLAKTDGSTLVGFLPSGTGAISRPVQSELRETITPFQFGGTGDGVANDSAAFLAASVAAVAQGKDVDFGGHTWLLGTQIALTSAHNGLRWRLRGATIKKGFSGNLCTLTACKKFSIDGVGVIDGQHGTYTGKGFVLSGASDDPYFGPGIIFTSFTDSHIEFGADSGESAKVYCNFYPGSGQTSYRAVHVNGPDTQAVHRTFVGSFAEIGYFDFDGAQATIADACTVLRMETDSATTVFSVTGGSWSNGGVAMTLNCSHGQISNVRFAGDLTLSATFSGVLSSPRFTSGKLINLSTVAVIVGDRQPRSIIANTYVEATVGATTAETALATISIPSGLLRITDRLEITAEFLWTSSANAKTPRFRFGASGAGLGGSIGFSYVATTTNTSAVKMILQNKGALNAQSMFSTAITGGTASAQVTNAASSAIDTSADSEIVISGEKANSGETLILLSYTVELIRTP